MRNQRVSVLAILCLSAAGSLTGQTVENRAAENLPQSAVRGETSPRSGAPPAETASPGGEIPSTITMPGLSELRGDAEYTPVAQGSGPTEPGQQTLPDYRIGTGDILGISVWREPEVSVDSVAVRSDGKISLPLIKEIHAVGLRPSELETNIKNEFARYINNPEVTVIVREINSQKVYLVGGVVRPGSIILRTPMTVLQVLAEAGGLTDFARKKRIYVLRKEGGRETRLMFNYSEVLKGDSPEQNVTVRAGDTIVVPE